MCLQEEKDDLCCVGLSGSRCRFLLMSELISSSEAQQTHRFMPNEGPFSGGALGERSAFLFMKRISEQNLKWLELNKDSIVFSRAADCWTERVLYLMIFSYELKWINTELELKNDSIVSLELNLDLPHSWSCDCPWLNLWNIDRRILTFKRLKYSQKRRPSRAELNSKLLHL